MNQTKAGSNMGNVPFSWENKPGVAKNFQEHNIIPIDRGHLVIKLPPPPCPTMVTCNRTPTRNRDIRIPLPPCAFQPPPHAHPLRSSSGKGLYYKNGDDDPFLAAYKKCTKSKIATTKGTKNKLSKIDAGLRKGLLSFSCKSSCGVLEGNMVRVSQLPWESE